MKFDDTGKRKVFNIDLDGTLALGGPFWERDPEPAQDMIEAVRRLYQAGNVIIIWTARQWEHAPETAGWLIKHRVPFHGLYMAKGGSDCYVDDKAVTPTELVKQVLTERSYGICDKHHYKYRAGSGCPECAKEAPTRQEAGILGLR